MTLQDNTAKNAVIGVFIICCFLSLALVAKQAINANKSPNIQKVQIVNYAEILEAVENEKKEIIDSIKNEVKELKEENQKLMAKANKPQIIVRKEVQKEVEHNISNQIVVQEKYTPNFHLLQKKSGNLEIIE